MYPVAACLVCGSPERTIVSKYNRFIFMESMWQSDLARFDYALCHGCGLVYATRRPDPDEYKFLYDNFNEFLMRGTKAKKYTELTPDGMKEMDAQFVPWWEIRSNSQSGSFYKILRHDFEKMLELLPHIALHVPLKGAKILHIRAKSSTLGDIAKRLFGAAQTDVITLFPHSAYVALKNQGVRAESCLNYEDFRIPFDERYHLIIENHILLHMLNPNATFEVFRSHLEAGGYLFFHNELNDQAMFSRRKNLFSELRPFHFQQYDIPTLERVFGRYGFETVFANKKEGSTSELFGLAKLKGEPGPTPRIRTEELKARLDMYAQWHDESILSLPKQRCRALFGDELDGVWERVRASGALGTGSTSSPLALRRFRKKALDEEDPLEIDVEIERRRAEREGRRRLQGTERHGEGEDGRAAAEAEREARRAAKMARRAEKERGVAATNGTASVVGQAPGEAPAKRRHSRRMAGRLLSMARRVASVLTKARQQPPRSDTHG